MDFFFYNIYLRKYTRVHSLHSHKRCPSPKLLRRKKRKKIQLEPHMNLLAEKKHVQFPSSGLHHCT